MLRIVCVLNEAMFVLGYSYTNMKINASSKYGGWNFVLKV